MSVVLGDVEFNPIEGGDFRLSVEGTSGTGKSNTLRVILEDLAEVNLPTLVVERLGAITPVRTEDENLIVVGGRDEEGIDLTVPLESLDMLGGLVLDRGMKILLDVSTYADYEDERSRIHLAAATAIRSLNDRAHEKYRAGDRTPSLLAIDEAHLLAPKDTAPTPELDEWVKRCRGQIIKASTEGGNKGVSVVVAYQRRAFLHNGVLQLVADYVAHRPGNEDISRTANAIRCPEDELANLSTGDIVARGPQLTGGNLVGPTKVRRCRSPDPREETFELPETPPEVTDALEDIQEQVEEEQREREKRQDRIKELEAANEEKAEKIERLQEQLDDQERLTRALENMQSGNGGADAEVADQLESIKADRDALRQRLTEAQDERDHFEDKVGALESEVETLEAELAELREAQAFRDEVVSFAEDVIKRFGDGLPETEPIRLEGAELDQTTVQRLEKIASSAEAIDDEEVIVNREDLGALLNEAAKPSGPEIEELDDYQGFLELPVTKRAIDRAKEEAGPRAVKMVIASIVQEGGPVDYDTVAKRLGHEQTSHVSRAATALSTAGVVRKDKTGNGVIVDLDTDNVEEMLREEKRRRQAEEIAEAI